MQLLKPALLPWIAVEENQIYISVKKYKSTIREDEIMRFDIAK